VQAGPAPAKHADADNRFTDHQSVFETVPDPPPTIQTFSPSGCRSRMIPSQPERQGHSFVVSARELSPLKEIVILRRVTPFVASQWPAS